MMMTTTRDKELDLAVSYYQLYSNTDRPINAISKECSTSEECVWVEDEWTLEDEQEAATRLQQAVDRCQVSTRIIEDNETAWDRFYSHHQTKFFKDRHYLATAFPHEFGQQSSSNNNTPQCLVEVGCGVGNALLPLLQDTNWTVYGIDLSPVAIDLLQQEERFQAASKEGRAFAFCCDISKELPCRKHVATVTSLLFCLSAIDPEDQPAAVGNIVNTLQPGGVLVIRDYGRYDEAQLKLGSQRNKLLKDNFYCKHDGTKCFYFTLEDLRNLFVEQAGLEELELDYIRRVYYNRKMQTTRRRVWVQGRFRKV